MINVTEKAKDELHDMLQQAGVQDAEIGIRLTATQGEGGQVQLALVLDESHEGDQVVEHEGRKVLLVDQFIAEQIDGATLDVAETPEGNRLTISR
ncbi:MAG TPA: iron-sulfur cluster biosynthesis family protein [Chloroflexota bacterium]